MDTTLKQQVLTRIAALPENADFREILRTLRALRPKQKSRQTFEVTQPQQAGMLGRRSSRSFLDAAQRYAGCIKDAPPDLATNPEYMEGYGA